MLPCHIIRDLLPSHVDGLTSRETDENIEEHLRDCPDCREMKAAMNGEIILETAPPKEKIVFKKLRRQQIIGAVLTVLITLYCLVGLYNLEYAIDLSSTASIEQAINEMPSFNEVNADVLEMVTVQDRVFVLYRDGAEEEYIGHGVVQFEKGIFGKYRIRDSYDTSWPLVYFDTSEIRGKSYLMISCVNTPKGAQTFRIYPNYPDDGWFYLADLDAIPLPEGDPVYEGTAEKEMLIVHPLTKEEAEARYHPFFERYYDAEGNILDSAEIAREYGYDGSRGGGGTVDRAPVEMYVYMVIVLIIGIVFIRYFLVP